MIESVYSINYSNYPAVVSSTLQTPGVAWLWPHTRITISHVITGPALGTHWHWHCTTDKYGAENINRQRLVGVKIL